MKVKFHISFILFQLQRKIRQRIYKPLHGIVSFCKDTILLSQMSNTAKLSNLGRSPKALNPTTKVKLVDVDQTYNFSMNHFS